ncbi:hypothetical protein LIER_10338 [Lithospermum erythrorhizon]|uniref:Integrase catalytic domain-containing protein n=1 Tax=Lithospermum erythrorhizon TaxID=34254 RepID=A0AAV3PNW0_LITER
MNSSTATLDEILLEGKRSGDILVLDMLVTPQKALTSRAQEDVELWYKKLGHTNYHNIQQLIAKVVVRGLPPLVVVTARVLELLHMDLIGPMQVESIAGKKYVYVCVDDFSSAEGIKHEFSAPITPQQNDIVERNNRTLQEMERVMLHPKQIPIKFWVDALNMESHIHNRITLRPSTHTTSYEIWRGRKLNVQYFHIFGSACFLADREPRHKFDMNSDEGIFLVNDNSDDQTEKAPPVKPTDVDSGIEPAARIQRDHQVGNIIGQIYQGMTTRKKDRVDYRKMVGLIGETCFISKEEPKDVKTVLLDEYWINAM